MTSAESQIEKTLIEKLRGLKYDYRADIHDNDTLKQNFREKFEELNHVHLTDGEFSRLLEEIVTPDVFAAARALRGRNDFTRDDGTPLNYMLVNIRDWCKNHFEVINQLRINTDNSHRHLPPDAGSGDPAYKPDHSRLVGPVPSPGVRTHSREHAHGHPVRHFHSRKG